MKRLVANAISGKYQQILNCIPKDGTEIRPIDIIAQTGLDDSTVSYRLMQLERTRLITAQRRGKFLFVKLSHMEAVNND